MNVMEPIKNKGKINDIAALMAILGHKGENETLKYIGLYKKKRG